MFRWDLSKFDYPGPRQSEDLRIKFASEAEIGSAAEVWYEGLSQEEGSPWANYLKKWAPASAAKWFLELEETTWSEDVGRRERREDCWNQRDNLREKLRQSRFFTGIVVSPSCRRQGIGSLILHKTLSDLKAEGLPRAEVETIYGIPAAKYLYPKYGGKGIQVPA